MPPILLPNALFWLCQGPKGGYVYNAQCIVNLLAHAQHAIPTTHM
jgi:hypothetical protein